MKYVFHCNWLWFRHLLLLFHNLLIDVQSRLNVEEILTLDICI